MNKLGLTGSYSLFPLHPDQDGLEGVQKVLSRLRNGALQGLNITIPYKQAVLPLVDECTPAAVRIGAVNTLYMKQKKLLGDNTDAQGFLNDLVRLGLDTRRDAGDAALVLGAGGAARAVVYALLERGWHIRVAARRLQQALQLAEEMDPGGRSIIAENIHPETFQQPYSLIVNTTPLGMQPSDVSTPWPREIPFPVGAAVYDLVYHQQTTFVKSALAAGLPAANGLGMLVEQAALSFEIWTGLSVPRNALWQAVIEPLQTSELQKKE